MHNGQPDTPEACLQAYWGLPPNRGGAADGSQWLNVTTRVYYLAQQQRYIDLISAELVMHGQNDPAPNQQKYFMCFWDERIARGYWPPGGVILSMFFFYNFRIVYFYVSVFSP